MYSWRKPKRDQRQSQQFDPATNNQTNNPTISLRVLCTNCVGKHNQKINRRDIHFQFQTCHSIFWSDHTHAQISKYYFVLEKACATTYLCPAITKHKTRANLHSQHSMLNYAVGTTFQQRHVQVEGSLPGQSASTGQPTL